MWYLQDHVGISWILWHREPGFKHPDPAVGGQPALAAGLNPHLQGERNQAGRLGGRESNKGNTTFKCHNMLMMGVNSKASLMLGTVALYPLLPHTRSVLCHQPTVPFQARLRHHDMTGSTVTFSQHWRPDTVGDHTRCMLSPSPTDCPASSAFTFR